MSLFGTLNTAVSGLSAQASKLGTIGDNIANSSTTGYKQASVEFETLLGNQGSTTYESGGVQTRVRYGITDQGTITRHHVGDRPRHQGQRLLRRAERLRLAGFDQGRVVRAGCGGKSRQYGRLQADGLQPPRRLHADRQRGGRTADHQSVDPVADRRPLQDRQPVGQPSLERCGRHGEPAVRQHGRLDLHGQDLAGRLRQSRQCGHTRRLPDQNRREHLAGRHLQSRRMPPRAAAFRILRPS